VVVLDGIVVEVVTVLVVGNVAVAVRLFRDIRVGLRLEG